MLPTNTLPEFNVTLNNLTFLYCVVSGVVIWANDPNDIIQNRDIKSALINWFLFQSKVGEYYFTYMTNILFIDDIGLNIFNQTYLLYFRLKQL